MIDFDPSNTATTVVSPPPPLQRVDLTTDEATTATPQTEILSSIVTTETPGRFEATIGRALIDSSIKAINPATNDIIGEIPVSNKSTVSAKVEESRKAFLSWSQLSIKERAGYLQKVYDLIVKKNEIAKTITQNNGKPRPESNLAEIAATLQNMEYFIANGQKLLKDKRVPLDLLYASRKSKLTYEPYGVVGLIQPWNYPFYLPMAAITKALIAGNTVVFKPSENTPLVGKLIEDLFKEACFPSGVLNVVHGDGKTGAALIEENLDKVVFTGSVEVGKKIAVKCAERLIPVSLELGGKDPAIVLKDLKEDSDIDYAARSILWGAFTNSGQACASIKRVYVEKEIYDRFLERLIELKNKLHVGNSENDYIDIGPIINKAQFEKIQAHLEAAKAEGATIHGGLVLERGGGYFLEPVILTGVNHSMKTMKEEIFGPVLSVMKVEDDEEAIELANDTEYGLAANIFTKDIKKADVIARKLKAGTVWINDPLFLQAHPATPWKGYKNSGYGGNGTIHDFVKPKHISIERLPFSFLHQWQFPYKGKAKLFSNLTDVLFGTSIKARAKGIIDVVSSFFK